MKEINWYKKAEKLWQLLDDIDTASDMFKPDNMESYKNFYDYVLSKSYQRHDLLISHDGYELIAAETHKENQEKEKRYSIIKEYAEKLQSSVDELIDSKKKEMTDSEYSMYQFKWSQIVTQEIIMWINMGDIVSKEEFESMCNIRGFDDSMKIYLQTALELVGLFQKDQ